MPKFRVKKIENFVLKMPKFRVKNPKFRVKKCQNFVLKNRKFRVKKSKISC